MALFVEKYKSTLDHMPTMLAFPLGMVTAMDGGLTFMTCMAIGAVLGTGFTGMGVVSDITKRKRDEFNTAAGQRIAGPVWALRAQEKLQHNIISTFDLAAKKPTSKYLKKRQSKLLAKADELNVHLMVLGNDNQPTDQSVTYLKSKPSL